MNRNREYEILRHQIRYTKEFTAYAERQLGMHVLATEEPTEQPGENVKISHVNDDNFIKAVQPYLPIRWAVVCLVFNIILPGCGTAVSGMLALCQIGQVRNTRLTSHMNRSTITAYNVAVGLSQLITVSLLFVGWIWSISWGVNLVGIAQFHRQKELKEQKRKQLEETAKALTTQNQHISTRRMINYLAHMNSVNAVHPT